MLNSNPEAIPYSVYITHNATYVRPFLVVVADNSNKTAKLLADFTAVLSYVRTVVHQQDKPMLVYMGSQMEQDNRTLIVDIFDDDEVILAMLQIL